MLLQRCLAVCLFFLSIGANAKLFTNSYISFELPPNWDCKLDGTEYVCVSQYAKQSKEAIIILAAKEAGPSDNLTAYMTHLKTTRSLPDKTGKMVPSKIIQPPKERRIANHPWVDGMHLGSEISSYYTRYLATIKEGLAILITFSAHKEHYSKYSNDFLKTVESLRVVATKDLLRGSTSPAVLPGNSTEVVGTPMVDPIATNIPTIPSEPKGQGMVEKLAALVLLLGAVGFYLWRKKKK